MVFQPIDPAPPRFRRRFKAIPVRTLLPNLITLLALCAGLTAIRMSVEGRLELALAAIVFAAMLDGIDGRDRKSTRLNSSHPSISYAVFCLKKKKKNTTTHTHNYPSKIHSHSF